MHSKPLKGNLQSMKRHDLAKNQSDISLFSQRRDILASGKGLNLKKDINPPVINYLSW